MADELHGSSLSSSAVLCAERHKELGLLKAASPDEIPDSSFAPIALFELAEAVRSHPVFFLGDETITPVVITGISPANQMLYQPVIHRLHPFSLQKLSDQNAAALLFDPDCQRMVPCKTHKDAIALFSTDGQPTEMLQLIINTAVQHYTSQKQAEIFANALKEAGVLSVSQLEYTHSENGQDKTLRFYMLNEKAYRNLPADTVHAWFKKGWLDAASLILMSHAHWYQHLNKSQNQRQA